MNLSRCPFRALSSPKGESSFVKKSSLTVSFPDYA